MATQPALGGLTTFNMLHGYAEAIVRGFRTGFLNDSDYHHLTQCETLEVRQLTVVPPHRPSYPLLGREDESSGDRLRHASRERDVG